MPPWAAPPRRSSAGAVVLIVLGSVMVLGGLVVSAGALVNMGRHNALRDRGVHTEGHVVGTFFGVDRQIEYSTPEGTYKAVMARPQASDVLRDGAIDVIYDQRNPSNANVASFVQATRTLDAVITTIAVVVAAAGVLCLVLGIVMLRRRQRASPG